MRRPGETEAAAYLALTLLDGYKMYTTGNFLPVAGVFNNAGIEPFGAWRCICRVACSGRPLGVPVIRIETSIAERYAGGDKCTSSSIDKRKGVP